MESLAAKGKSAILLEMACALLPLLLVLGWSPVWAEDRDSSITTIHNIDLTTNEGPSGPNYILILLDVKKAKVPGSRAHIIFRQFSKRVRLEYEASGLPHGKYKIGIHPTSCPKSEKLWTILHSATQESTHLATEKSLPKHALRKAVLPGQSVLLGMNVGLFQSRGAKTTLIDCKPIK